MVTNNAPFCHRHLRVKVKKHICHSRCTKEDNRTGGEEEAGDKGMEDGRGRGRTKRYKEKGRSAISDIERNRTYLLELDSESGEMVGGGQGEWEFRIN